MHKDPNSSGTEADIRAQLAMFSDIRADYAEVTSMVNRIEWVRRQLYDLQAVLEDRGGADEILAAAAELDENLIAVEDNLVRLITTGTGQDGVRWAPKLAEELRVPGRGDHERRLPADGPGRRGAAAAERGGRRVPNAGGGAVRGGRSLTSTGACSRAICHR